MKSINKILALLTVMLSIAMSSCIAQIKNVKNETVKVYGNCETCKKKIENASNTKHISKAVWNMENKTAMLTFDSTKTTADAILKNIAYAGYDNQNYSAPDAAYNGLDMCCQYERKMQKEEIKSIDKANISIQTDTVKNKTASQPEIISPLAAVYSAYFGLKDALTKDDGTSAASKAKELYKSIDVVQMEKLTNAQHVVWMKYQKELSYHAEHMKGTTDPEHQREHFISLSKNMYEVMKVIKNNVTVYYDFCPMANSGKGANWLSLQQPISNPYMGKSMATCGKVEDTIK